MQKHNLTAIYYYIVASVITLYELIYIYVHIHTTLTIVPGFKHITSV